MWWVVVVPSEKGKARRMESAETWHRVPEKLRRRRLANALVVDRRGRKEREEPPEAMRAKAYIVQRVAALSQDNCCRAHRLASAARRE